MLKDFLLIASLPSPSQGKSYSRKKLEKIVHVYIMSIIVVLFDSNPKNSLDKEAQPPGNSAKSPSRKATNHFSLAATTTGFLVRFGSELLLPGFSTGS